MLTIREVSITRFQVDGADPVTSYFATERITGRTDDGREGSFTVQHGGLESDPSTWFGHIVPHTGTGDFASREPFFACRHRSRCAGAAGHPRSDGPHCGVRRTRVQVVDLPS